MFRIAKQMARERYDVVGTSCLTLSLPVTRICVNYSTVYNDTLVAKGLKNDQGEIVSDGDEIKNVWRTYMKKLLNEENDWDMWKEGRTSV